MKKITIISLSLLLILTSCNADEGAHEDVPSSLNTEENYEYTTKTNLHFTLPLNDTATYPYPFIGDVHPYFDEQTQKWYLYYLDTSGRYQTKLAVSYDGIRYFEENDFNVKYGITPYSVLNVTKKDNTYYSYFAEFQCSQSSDLINWQYMGKASQIPLDTLTYNAGMRDPSVTYDAASQKFYAVGLVYKLVDNVKKSNLAITESLSNDAFSWSKSYHEVLAIDQVNHDYECPMLLKINDRWYLFASQYGNSIHGVGSLSYWIGDANASPYQVDWSSKEEHFLTGEDLCAAQVAQKDNQYYLFGWIPQTYNSGAWGGYLNLLTEVYALANGELATRFAPEMFNKLKKIKIATSSLVTLTSDHAVRLVKDRYVLEMSFLLRNSQLQLTADNYSIIIDKANHQIKVMVDDYVCASLAIAEDELTSLSNLRLIVEEKNIELELNAKYVLTARIKDAPTTTTTLTISGDQQTLINELNAFRLAYLEEMQ